MHDAVTDWQELSALYEKADQLSGATLEAWLATLRELPHPLLEPLLQMLGARSEIRGNGFLDALPHLTMAARGSAAAADAAAAAGEWQAGARIGAYRLEARLGAGGMAEVWRAQRNDGAFQRTVAIKLLFRHVGGPRQQQSFAQRFSRERDILASLHHPNIAALHDAGVTPAGQPWLALEYVEGETLTEWCDRTRLGVRGRVELFLQVLLAVQHAHANLVIHRDLKPANILVTTTGQVRLLDFGIAKLMEEGGDAIADTELTRHAGRLMTVRYASPEQLTGQPLTTACDVYSLGVVLYELLCGQLPYEPKVDTPAQIEQAVLEVEPRPPSRRAVTGAAAAARGSSDGLALRRALGSELDAVVLRALAKRPANRYASVEALRVELERWLAGEPVEARAPTRAYRLRKFVGRHVLGVSLGLSAVLVLIVIATVAVWLGLKARQESARATAARDFMMGMFKQADTDKSHGADMTARQLLDRGRDDVLKRLEGRPELQADLLRGIAGIQAGMEEFAKADTTWDRLATLYRRSGKRSEEATAVAARADIAMRMGNNSLAHELLKQAARIAPQIVDDASAGFGLKSTEGWLSLYEGDPARARSLFRHVVEYGEKAYGPLDRRTLDALTGWVRSEAALKNYDAAIDTEAELERRSLQAPDRSPHEALGVDVDASELMYLAGRYGAAVDRTRSALPRCVEAVGVNDRRCRRLAYGLISVELRRGNAEMVRSSLPMLEAVANDPSSPEFQRPALILLFRAYTALDESGRRSELLERMEALASDDTHSFDPARRSQALQALVEAALKANRLDQAEAWLGRAIALQGLVGDSRPGYPISGINLSLKAMIAFQQGDSNAALKGFGDALTSMQAVVGVRHPAVSFCALNQAAVLTSLGRNDEALALIRQVEIELKGLLGTDAPAYRQVLEYIKALDARDRPQELSALTHGFAVDGRVRSRFFFN